MTKKVFLFATILTLLPISIYAIPNRGICKPNKKNICVSNRSLPGKFRRNIPVEGQFLTPLLKYEILSGNYEEFPDTSGGTLGIKVAAGFNTKTLCVITRNGQLKCTDLVSFNDCPGSMLLQDESSGAWYECDLDCSASGPSGKPDSQGNCDCDVRYDTCKAA